MLQLAAAAPGLFVPLSFMLQLQMLMQLTVLMLLLKLIPPAMNHDI